MEASVFFCFYAVIELNNVLSVSLCFESNCNPDSWFNHGLNPGDLGRVLQWYQSLVCLCC
ncbi:hypothetical protein LINPERHAP1_LOCUS8032, partial [Linum perenne]